MITKKRSLNRAVKKSELIRGPETQPLPALLVSHPRWSDCERRLCELSYPFTPWMFQLWPLLAARFLLSVLILRLPPRTPVWLWLIQLGSGSCSPWGKFTQLTADQLFSGVLHGKKDHAAHMINNNRWRGGKKRTPESSTDEYDEQKGFQCPSAPTLSLWRSDSTAQNYWWST